MAHSYPMMVDVTRLLVVIVGGGAVAARKAGGLLDAGATRVRCVAPSFGEQMPPGIERIAEAYRPAHLDGASIVFAATDLADVNDAVVRDAHERRLLVNRADADDDVPGDFATPAKLRRGEVIVTVAAQSAALAAMIRDRLAQSFDPAWQRMADAMQEVRPLVKRAGLEIARRREVFKELVSDEAFGVLQEGGPGGLRAWLLARHPELTQQA